ncbi:thiamine-phosphate kinase [Campylobacter hominis]|uniref:Thiamine-monophosphate kinase n=1 Tax=Campylobacter hominis (strain ATCC BAA-381 / DSM 21671 / CCUG 45161 / LMG 19568 / NCTC 13146 / CH001A) TaxID=360107 RepID=A7I192_CAMHC|nr:thiamine-phosphate kinase [Campylobacter hominis]ABS51520.1 thiamine-monophosphate kinase (Thiamine-phosphatekinase) [Campylobacter hominis ATCC BAA-381]UAK86403.1 thiamine-phosphate kinase [Campylobacter hominis]SUW84821.1 thiamine monophosphate kinase [Campylobacter hominis]
MDKERYIFEKFSDKKNGDDGALVGKWVFSKDLFVQNIHFKRSWLSLRQIAVKSMLVNISDAVAMNARPKYALLGLELPKEIGISEIDELCGGFLDICKKFNIKIIGGDTISGDRISISVTIISKTKKAVFRKGAKIGDFIAFTGNLGSVIKDFGILENGGKIDENSKFITPDLKSDFFYKAAKFTTSAMDISDGLSQDLSRLLEKNGAGIKFLKNLSKDELFSGEEYEILFTFAKKNRDKILKIAKKTATKITIFGEIAELSADTKFSDLSKKHHFE